MTDRKELATRIEQMWMEYNAAVISQLHPRDVKMSLANLMVNNVNEIIDALRAEPAPETKDVITGYEGETKPKKVRK